MNSSDDGDADREDGEEEDPFSSMGHLELVALARNVRRFMDALPHQSWLKAPLVEHLFCGGPSSAPQQDDRVGLTAAVAMSGLSRNYLSKVPGLMGRKRAREDYQDPFQERAASGSFRKPCVDPEAVERHVSAHDWLKTNFVASKSGDKKEVYRTHFSRWSAFGQYCEGVGEDKAAGFHIFQAEWKNLGVTKAPHSLHDYFSCTICSSAKQRMEEFQAAGDALNTHLNGAWCQTATVKERQVVEQQVLENWSNATLIKVHLEKFQNQRERYLQQRASLEPGSLFITADFGVHQIQVSEGGAQQLPDLVLVLHWINQEGDLVHCYLDCLPLLDQVEKKDWNYVASAFNDLEVAGFFKSFSKIIWWSDTGPAHFRTSNTLYYFRQFQDRTGILVELNFFAPYHGHSMCDGHIGAISRAVTFAGNRLNGDLAKWNRAWVEERIMNLKMTQIVRVAISRPEKVVKTLVGIRAYLGFYFDKSHENSVTCRCMFGDQNILPTNFEFRPIGALDEDEEDSSPFDVASLLQVEVAGQQVFSIQGQ